MLLFFAAMLTPTWVGALALAALSFLVGDGDPTEVQQVPPSNCTTLGGAPLSVGAGHPAAVQPFELPIMDTAKPLFAVWLLTHMPFLVLELHLRGGKGRVPGLAAGASVRGRAVLWGIEAGALLAYVAAYASAEAWPQPLVIGWAWFALLGFFFAEQLVLNELCRERAGTS